MQSDRLINIFILVTFLCLWSADIIAANNCSIRVTPIGFGNYNVFSTANLDASTQITISCSPVTTTYTILLDSGLNGSVNNRSLRSNTSNDKLKYNLYTDASRSIIWGNGSGNSATVSNNTPNPIIIYGRIPAGQNAQVGGYSDTVMVTVDF